MQIKLEAYKAQGFPRSGGEVLSATLVMEDEIPSAKTLEAAEVHFIGDATAIEDLLWNTLPGGTYDRLLALMLKRKASHFIVPHGGREG